MSPETARQRPSRRVLGAVAGLLALQAALLSWGAFSYSPTWDEPAHVVSGVAYWTHGDFSIFRVNPPLTRLVGALPVIAAGAKTEWARLDHDRERRPEMILALDFVGANGEEIFRLVTLARLAIIPLVLLGGLACFGWAHELHGPLSGLFAMALWTASPMVLGHGSLATADASAAALGVSTAWLAWRWTRRPTWCRALVCGAALGLALATKSSWIFLPALIAACWALTRPWGAAGRSLRSETLQLVTLLLGSLLLLNACYGFQGALRPLGEYSFRTETLSGLRLDEDNAFQRGNRFSGSILARLPVPLPSDFLLGLDEQAGAYERPMNSYLDGELRRGGWRSFYVRGLLWKLPLGTLALLVLALVASALRRDEWSPGWRVEAWTWAPPLILLALLSSHAGRTMHVRYMLPLIPFLAVFVARLARGLSGGAPRPRRTVALVGVGLLACVAAASLSASPHWLGSFNLLAGGSRGGPEHLLDSNVDWGQDLLHLARWLERHPEARPLSLSYYGFVDPRLAGIEAVLTPARPSPGWHAVSVNFLHGLPFWAPDLHGGYVNFDPRRVAWLRDEQPVARIGTSILVFGPTEDTASGHAVTSPTER